MIHRMDGGGGREGRRGKEGVDDKQEGIKK